jgi:hypothetical protein
MVGVPDDETGRALRNVQPRMAEPARSHTVLDEVMVTFIESTISLKKNGT